MCDLPPSYEDISNEVSNEVGFRRGPKSIHEKRKMVREMRKVARLRFEMKSVRRVVPVISKEDIELRESYNVFKINYVEGVWRLSYPGNFYPLNVTNIFSDYRFIRESIDVLKSRLEKMKEKMGIDHEVTVNRNKKGSLRIGYRK